MKRILSIFILAVTALFMVGSCEKETPLESGKPFTIDMFPNTLGRNWEYEVIDNLQPIDTSKPDGPVIDTVSVTISDILTDPVTGKQATVWRYFSSTNSDLNKVNPVSFNGNIVFYFWNWDPVTHHYDSLGFVFPFDVNDRWRSGGLFSGDSTVVTERTSLRVTAGVFDEVYVIENHRRTTISTDKRVITFWFVPDLGPVKIHLHEEHALSVGDTTWTLTTHNFPGF